MNPCTFEYIYFENAPKCRKNVEYRMEQGDTRKVFGAIELFSEQYKIPENIVPLKVYEEHE